MSKRHHDDDHELWKAIRRIEHELKGISARVAALEAGEVGEGQAGQAVSGRITLGVPR